MQITYIYDSNGDAVGVEIDNVFYKIVGVEYKDGSTFSTPNARTPTQAEIQAISLQKANDLNTYVLKNTQATNPPPTVKTQKKNSFWEGFNADTVFAGIVTVATSIFGNRAQQTTDQVAIYGTTTPYLAPQRTDNSTLYIIVIAVVLVYLFSQKTTKDQ
jgi:hypothetical protein